MVAAEMGLEHCRDIVLEESSYSATLDREDEVEATLGRLGRPLARTDLGSGQYLGVVRACCVLGM